MSQDAILTREAFFAACSRRGGPNRIVTVHSAELGGRVYVKILTAGQVGAIDKQADGDYDRAVLLVLAAIMDENGQPMFKEKKAVEDLDFDIFTAVSVARNEATKIDPEAIAKN